MEDIQSGTHYHGIKKAKIEYYSFLFLSLGLFNTNCQIHHYPPLHLYYNTPKVQEFMKVLPKVSCRIKSLLVSQK